MVVGRAEIGRRSRLVRGRGWGLCGFLLAVGCLCGVSVVGALKLEAVSSGVWGLFQTEG